MELSICGEIINAMVNSDAIFNFCFVLWVFGLFLFVCFGVCFGFFSIRKKNPYLIESYPLKVMRKTDSGR